MNSNWAEWAIKHKQVIHFFSALIAIMGIFCYAVLGRQEDPNNFLLMHAAGANVSGQVASVIAGGLIITLVENLL